MKLKIVFLSLLTTALGFSQASSTQEVSKTMSKGVQPGIQVSIANISEDDLEDAIKDVTKPYKGKKRKIKRTSEFFLDDASINEISANTIDIHQTIEKTEEGYIYTAYFNLGGIFLDSAYSTEKFAYAVDIVNRIAQKATENRTAEILKAENKKLENLEDDKKKLEKEIDKDSKAIQDAKDLIAKKERGIEDSVKMIENKSNEIETQRQLINSIRR